MSRFWSELIPELVNRTQHKLEKQAAVCLLLRPSISGGLFDLLYMQRSNTPGDYWAGQIGFPGGKRDLSDKDIQFTAEREFEEEMGFTLHGRSKFLGELNSVQGRKRGVLMDFTIHPFVYLLEGDSPFNPDPAEVGDYFWLQAESLIDSKNMTSFNLEYQGKQLSLPALKFPKNTLLWGLTYMLTKDFLTRLEKSEEILEISKTLNGKSKYLEHMIEYPG